MYLSPWGLPKQTQGGYRVGAKAWLLGSMSFSCTGKFLVPQVASEPAQGAQAGAEQAHVAT